MCIIASVPAGMNIEQKKLDTMWKHNSDGGGIAWIENGKVKTFKSMKLKPFKKKFKEVQKLHGNSDIMIHMRIATHGSVCMDNNHPFNVDTQTVFAHNGILPRSFHPPSKRDISDTRYFNETFLQYQKLTALDDNRYLSHLGDIINGGNKLVILSSNPKLHKDSYIVNEQSGEWVDGVWFSNDSHEEYSWKMNRWGQSKTISTQSSQQRIVDTETGEITIGDYSAIRPIAGIDDETIETLAQWKIVPSTAWDDDKFRDKVIDFCAEWGYDSVIDWFEDNQLKVVDGNIVCEDCKGPIDLAGYPEHETTCHVLYNEALEQGVDPEEFFMGNECEVPLAEDEEVDKSERQLQLALDEFDKSEAKKKPKKGKK